MQEILGALHVLQSCCYFGSQKRKKRGRKRGGVVFSPPVIVTFNAGRRGDAGGGEAPIKQKLPKSITSEAVNPAHINAGKIEE